jgi:hypothetical protein
MVHALAPLVPDAHAAIAFLGRAPLSGERKFSIIAFAKESQISFFCSEIIIIMRPQGAAW